MADAGPGNLAVLVYAPFGKDSVLIEQVLLQSSFSAQIVPRLQGLGTSICEDAGAAIIAEEALQNGTITALALKISSQPPWSDFPIIVLTGCGMSTDSSESAVRSRAPLGNMTQLERPLRPVTVISAVRAGLLARRRQYEVRDHLREWQAAIRRGPGIFASGATTFRQIELPPCGSYAPHCLASSNYNGVENAPSTSSLLCLIPYI